MRSLKSAFIAAALALFALACNNALNTTNNAGSAQPKPNATAAAAHRNANDSTENELAGAREIYQARCVKCHGANAEGGRVEFDNIKMKVPGLREGHVRNHTSEQLARRISKGGEGMPAFKDKLTPEEIDALAHLIQHDFQGQNAAANAPVTPQNP